MPSKRQRRDRPRDSGAGIAPGTDHKAGKQRAKEWQGGDQGKGHFLGRSNLIEASGRVRLVWGLIWRQGRRGQELWPRFKATRLAPNMAPNCMCLARLFAFDRALRDRLTGNRNGGRRCRTRGTGGLRGQRDPGAKRGSLGVAFIVAIAGPPGAGKSTLAAAVVARLGPGARVVPMDGFHLDNAVLDARGLRARKGAPETFDAAGFVHLMRRLRRVKRRRSRCLTVWPILRVPGRMWWPKTIVFLIVEGNYLLLDQAHWRDLAATL